MSVTSNPAKHTRNEYIDACRGVAAISVVAIHTAFFGYPDVPTWFKSLTLFVDVPFFFYLSGWASSYKQPDVLRALKSVLKIWFQWLVFILVINIFCYISLKLPYSYMPVTNIRDLAKCLLFDQNISPGFFVVGMSTWFMPYYMATILINNALLRLVRDSKRRDMYCIAYIAVLILLVFWAYMHPGCFGYHPPFFLFYSALWTFGYIRAEKRSSAVGFIITLCLCAVGLYFFCYLDVIMRGIPWYDMQDSKCIPSGKYLFASLFFIFIGGNLERFVKKANRVLSHIGKNALYYFFGQGVGSSILAYGHISLDIRPWGLKWVVYFLINLVITIFVAEISRYIYKGINALFDLIYKKIRRIE
ncbi:MAG: acyltransferase [Lachnospiraceae bacterium]|nr:acyltransferase [Lachnospiraceae bacterium]